MNRKKGISLIVLAITIIVMIILASVVIFISADTTNNSKKAAFASDLEEIESLVQEYYLTNGELPISSGSEYSKTTLTNLVTEGKDTLSSEITENGDDSAAFYKLDLTKLPIETSKRGMGIEDNTNDVYVVTSQTFNVYYVKGEKIDKLYYFSLSESLTGKKKIANSQTFDTSNITISNSTGTIKLTKSTAEYTNDLTVGVKVELAAGETMVYKIAGQQITVQDNATTINVASAVNNNSTIKNAFYQSDANKYLVAQKYSSGNIIAESKISISNLDVLSGNVSNVNVTYSKYDEFRLANVSGYTDLGGSGVKEARVLYTTKKLSDETISAYYSDLPSTITKEYVKNAGKVFNATTLKLPTDVNTYALVFIDNAGNVSDVITFTVN